MTDTRKIRVRIDVDFVLTQDEYSGGDDEVTAEDAIATMRRMSIRDLISDWSLIEKEDVELEIVP